MRVRPSGSAFFISNFQKLACNALAIQVKKEVHGPNGIIQRFFCPAQSKRISHSQYELTQTLKFELP